MELKSYYVNLEDGKKIDEEVNFVFEKLKELQVNFDKIYEEVDKLNPQQKLIFLDNILTNIVLRSQMPVFYLNALMVKLSEYVKSLDGGVLKEAIEEKNYTASYLG